MSKVQAKGVRPPVPCIIHVDWYMGNGKGNAIFNNEPSPAFEFVGNPSRPRDYDNAVSLLKAVVDGMKDGGLFEDDTFDHVRGIFINPIKDAKEHKKKRMLVITFQEA